MNKITFKSLEWVNIVFFTLTAVTTLTGIPIYFAKAQISLWLAALTLFYFCITGLAITVGYHRLFSHVTYKAHPLVRFLFLFFGAAAFEQSVLKWASDHRKHHQYLDTELDPYSIKHGFFHAHIGWLTFHKREYDFENVKDLLQDKMVMHQHRHYLLWALVSGIVFPVLAGAWMGFSGGALLFAVCLRITAVHHATFFINSLCHSFGKNTYDIHTTAKDNWVAALLTFGEGYHNFHHRFPSDYRNAVRWYQWDPSKWLIRILERVGLTKDLKKISMFQILQAKVKADYLKIAEQLPRRIREDQIKGKIQTRLSRHYEILCHRLLEWEQWTRTRERLALQAWAHHSKNIHFELKNVSAQLNEARHLFQAAYRQFQQARRSLFSLIENGSSCSLSAY